MTVVACGSVRLFPPCGCRRRWVAEADEEAAAAQRKVGRHLALTAAAGFVIRHVVFSLPLLVQYLFMGPGHSQNFGNGLWVESVLNVSRVVSHCTGSCSRTYVEYTVGMSVRQQGRNSQNLIIQGM